MRNYGILVLGILLVFYTGVAYAQDTQTATTVAPSQQVMRSEPVAQQVTQTQVVTEKAVTTTTETMTETSPSFGTQMKNGCVAVGRGIKKGAVWTWNGMKKGAFYMKEGTVSALEKMGIKKNKAEIDEHEKLIQEANRALAQSKARREVRNRQRKILEKTIVQKDTVVQETVTTKQMQ